MEEIARGIYMWTAFHDTIKQDVCSYYVEPAATIIDPKLPAEGLSWFEGRNVERVVLTNRHHYRDSDRIHERWGVPVLAVEQGMHEIGDKPGVQSFAFGDQVAPSITAHPVDPSWPDEGVLHIELGPGLLAVADGAIRPGDDLRFVPDQHIGEDPERIKELLRHGYGRLLDLEFDTLLLAHGRPVVGGGKEALKQFAESGLGG